MREEKMHQVKVTSNFKMTRSVSGCILQFQERSPLEFYCLVYCLNRIIYLQNEILCHIWNKLKAFHAVQSFTTLQGRVSHLEITAEQDTQSSRDRGWKHKCVFEVTMKLQWLTPAEDRLWYHHRWLNHKEKRRMKRHELLLFFLFIHLCEDQ